MERETDLWIKFLIPTETADMTILTMCSTGNMPMNRIMKKFFTTKNAANNVKISPDILPVYYKNRL